MNVLYQCEICGATYKTQSDAKACEGCGFHPKFKIGDIVTFPSGYTWYNGDDVWIAGRSGRDKETFMFYAVVVFVDGDPRDKHRPRYHLAHGAIRPRRDVDSLTVRYNFDEGHIPMTLVKKVPRRLNGEARKIVAKGYRATDLL
jgi:hypothetical protein